MKRLKLDEQAYLKLKKKVLDRDKWKCRHCKRREQLHVHHVVYRSHGGQDTLCNLLSLCSGCHDCIHDKGRYRLRMSQNPELWAADGSIDANKEVSFWRAT